MYSPVLNIPGYTIHLAFFFSDWRLSFTLSLSHPPSLNPCLPCSPSTTWPLTVSSQTQNPTQSLSWLFVPCSSVLLSWQEATSKQRESHTNQFISFTSFHRKALFASARYLSNLVHCPINLFFSRFLQGPGFPSVLLLWRNDLPGRRQTRTRLHPLSTNRCCSPGCVGYLYRR